jgi:hypothetical protein
MLYCNLRNVNFMRVICRQATEPFDSFLYESLPGDRQGFIKKKPAQLDYGRQ